MNMPYHCDVDRCTLKATFASEDLEHLACTKHARRGFTVYPTVLRMQVHGDKPRMYSEGLGNLHNLRALKELQR